MHFEHLERCYINVIINNNNSSVFPSLHYGMFSGIHVSCNAIMTEQLPAA
uniref:Uncharacterized protein n=1 Tax=Anguilla anguilla TaxID=7936 RepID=A0A0E9RNI3_ANGAN